MHFSGTLRLSDTYRKQNINKKKSSRRQVQILFYFYHLEDKPLLFWGGLTRNIKGYCFEIRHKRKLKGNDSLAVNNKGTRVLAGGILQQSLRRKCPTSVSYRGALDPAGILQTRITQRSAAAAGCVQVLTRVDVVGSAAATSPSLVANGGLLSA